MPKLCKSCGRPRQKGHICDTVRLSDGRTVHASRVAVGGDLHDKLDKDGLKVVARNITPEMREQLGY